MGTWADTPGPMIGPAVETELSASERIAEHTGHQEYSLSVEETNLYRSLKDAESDAQHWNVEAREAYERVSKAAAERYTAANLSDVARAAQSFSNHLSRYVVAIVNRRNFETVRGITSH